MLEFKLHVRSCGPTALAARRASFAILYYSTPSGAYADRARLSREAPSGIDFGADLAGHLGSLLQEQETIDVG